MDFAPIVLFVYNRLDHLKLTLKSLKKNKEASNTDLIIYSDGPKNKLDKVNVYKVRSFLKKVSGFKKKKIICRVKNIGLANNIVNGINQTFKNTIKQ